jgi:membrane complex biogenesis BtpA family protein
MFQPGAKALLGVIHLPPLPGAPRYDGDMAALRARTAEDALALAAAGFDAVLVENFGDAPFFRDAVPAGDRRGDGGARGRGARRASGLPLGVNVLRNDGASALAVAAATGARFMRVNVLVGARVTDQGVIASEAAELLRLRRSLDAQRVSLVADVGVKHSAPLAGHGSLEEEAVEAVERSLADALVVTGARTGEEASEADVARVRAASHGRPVWLGSGVRAETLGRWLSLADGVIVGSDLRDGGRAGGPIDPARAKRFAAARHG